MSTYTVTILDTRVNVKLEYEVYAPDPKTAEKEAILKANKDAGTPAWLLAFKAIRTEVQ